MFQDNNVIKTLKDNHITFFVVGTGGIGFNLVKYLIDEGIEGDKIFCIDDDRIDFPTMYKYGYSNNIREMETKVDALRSMMRRRELMKEKYNNKYFDENLNSHFINGKYYYGFFNTKMGREILYPVRTTVVIDCLDNSDYSKLLYDELKSLNRDKNYFSSHYDGNNVSIFHAQRSAGDSSGYNVGTSTMLSEMSALLVLFYIATSINKPYRSHSRKGIIVPLKPIQINLKNSKDFINNLAYFKKVDKDKLYADEYAYINYLRDQFPKPKLQEFVSCCEEEWKLPPEGELYEPTGNRDCSNGKPLKPFYSLEGTKPIEGVNHDIKLDFFIGGVFAPLIIPDKKMIQVMKEDENIFNWAVATLLDEFNYINYESYYSNSRNVDGKYPQFTIINDLGFNLSDMDAKTLFIVKSDIIKFILNEVRGEKNELTTKFSKKDFRSVFKRATRKIVLNGRRYNDEHKIYFGAKLVSKETELLRTAEESKNHIRTKRTLKYPVFYIHNDAHIMTSPYIWSYDYTFSETGFQDYDKAQGIIYTINPKLGKYASVLTKLLSMIKEDTNE